MSGQRLLGATLVWLVVVSSVSALVWVVISRAGDDLTASDQPLMTSASGSAVVPPTTAVRPSRTPSKTPSRTPSATPTKQPSATPSTAAGTPSASPSTTPPPTSSSPPKEQPANATTERSQTWQGQAGSLVVSCGATGIRLVSAQPADGFRADVHREDDLIDVEFEGREDRSGTHVRVEARCVGGAPSFSTHSEQDD